MPGDRSHFRAPQHTCTLTATHDYAAIQARLALHESASTQRAYVPGKMGGWPALSSLIGVSINRKLIKREFDDVVCLAASIQQGTVTASLILRKLSAYGLFATLL